MKIKLEVHPALEDLLGSLDRDEIHLLYDSVKRHGCLSPILYWVNDGHNWIVDGINRWYFCEEKGIDYQVRAMPFGDMVDAMRWMVENQTGRRNWSDGQKALAYEKLSRAEADRRINANGQPHSNKPLNRHDGGSTAYQKAAVIGVSARTMERASTVASNAVPEVQAAVLAGKLPLAEAATISQQSPPQQRQTLRERNRKPKEEPKAKPVDELGKEIPVDLLAVFAAREGFDEALNHLAAISKLLNPLMGNPSDNVRAGLGGEHLAPHRTRVLGLIGDLRSAVKFARPYAPCPKSHKAAKCDVCGDCGWVTKEIFEAAGIK